MWLMRIQATAEVLHYFKLKVTPPISHLPDICVTRPIIHDGRLIGFANVFGACLTAGAGNPKYKGSHLRGLLQRTSRLNAKRPE